MKRLDLANDDISDVIELTSKLEESMDEILGGNVNHLALSALINATTRCIVNQCSDVDEIAICQRVFSAVLDRAINQIKNLKLDDPA